MYQTAQAVSEPRQSWSGCVSYELAARRSHIAPSYHWSAIPGLTPEAMRYTQFLLEVRVTSLHKTTRFAAIAIALAGMAQAQVPPDIAKKLVEIGRGVCVPETAALYRPLHHNPPYKGGSITRH